MQPRVDENSAQDTERQKCPDNSQRCVTPSLSVRHATPRRNRNECNRVRMVVLKRVAGASVYVLDQI